MDITNNNNNSVFNFFALRMRHPRRHWLAQLMCTVVATSILCVLLLLLLLLLLHWFCCCLSSDCHTPLWLNARAHFLVATTFPPRLLRRQQQNVALVYVPLLFCVDFSYFAVRMCNIAAAFFQYFVCKRVACSQFLDFFQAFSIDSDIFSISFYYFLSIFVVSALCMYGKLKQ